MARIRKTVQKSAKFWLIGLYLRLSKEDELKDGSTSIVNQEKILHDFVEEHFELGSHAIVYTYIDDGRTGTDTNRPEFQRMEQDIISKKINCIIMKSLARGFRNLGDQQKFLEEFVPIHNTRFINLSAPFIDTFVNPRAISSIEVPIRGMFNEQFAATTSEEIRKTFKMKRERGEFIGAFAPYGYKKNPKNKNALLIDEYAANVVQSMFHYFVNEGYSKRGIAQRLSDLGEPNPTAYKKKLGLKYQSPTSALNDGLWSVRTVSAILQNEMYIGTMVQGKNRVVSYKVHTQISVPEEEWFVVPNTHEPIIDAMLFEKAQALCSRDTRAAPQNRALYLLSGFIRCADCKKAMHRKTAKGTGYYACRSYSDKKICSKHSIRQDKLEYAVLRAIQTQISLTCSVTEIIAHINTSPVSNREAVHLNHALSSAEKQLKAQQDISDSLYIDWKSGELSREEHHRIKSKTADQIGRIETTIENLKREIQTMSDETSAGNPHLTSFLKHKNIQTLDRSILVELIDMIWVQENGAVDIDFNFSNELPWPSENV